MYRSIFLHQSSGRQARGLRRLAAAGPRAANILGIGGGRGLFGR